MNRFRACTKCYHNPGLGDKLRAGRLAEADSEWEKGGRVYRLRDGGLNEEVIELYYSLLAIQLLLKW